MTLRRIALILLAFVILLVVVFVFQNIETVPVNFLFWSFEAQRALIFLGFFLLGIAAGLAIPVYRRSRRWIAERRGGKPDSA